MSQHTEAENFEHFLTYTGLGNQPDDVKRVLRKAFEMEATGNACTWTGDEWTNEWVASCGDSFYITDGTPEDNSMKFCPFCGKPILVLPEGTPEE